MKIAPPVSTFENPPAGVYPVRLYRIVDLGTQPVEYQGQIRHARKIAFTFELLGDERMSDGRPYSITKRMTASLANKSALRSFLEQWRGRAYKDEELADGLDLSRILGQYGLANIQEGISPTGAAYVTIASISPLPKGFTKPEPVNPAVLFDLDAPDWSVFEGFSERLRETIAKSPEYAKARASAPQEEPFADDEVF